MPTDDYLFKTIVVNGIEHVIVLKPSSVNLFPFLLPKPTTLKWWELN